MMRSEPIGPNVLATFDPFHFQQAASNNDVSGDTWWGLRFIRELLKAWVVSHLPCRLEAITHRTLCCGTAMPSDFQKEFPTLANADFAHRTAIKVEAAIITASISPVPIITPHSLSWVGSKQVAARREHAPWQLLLTQPVRLLKHKVKEVVAI